MFQNISFSFLCALAFISWSVLCYLKAIEQHQPAYTYDVELYSERPTYSKTSGPCTYQSSQPFLTNRAYEMLISYGIVLATTAMLSKLLHWLELLARNYLQKDANKLNNVPSLPFVSIESINTTGISPNSTNSLLPQSGQENVELRGQLNDLQFRCQELLHELRVVNSNANRSSNRELSCNKSNSSFIDSDSSFENFQDNDNSQGVIMWKQPIAMSSSSAQSIHNVKDISTISLTQNVYVAHNHFYLNIDESLHFPRNNLDIGLMRPNNIRKCSEFLQVWGKFIQAPVMQRPMFTGVNNILI